MISCQCGCGEYLWKYLPQRPNRIRKFIKGHINFNRKLGHHNNVLTLCKCGCAEELYLYDNRGRVRHYKIGHFGHGDESPHWTGGRIKHTEGYWLVKASPERCNHHVRRDHHAYIFEHILLFEEHHKCCMLKWGRVRHINGIKLDNRLENLEGTSQRMFYKTIPHDQLKPRTMYRRAEQKFSFLKQKGCYVKNDYCMGRQYLCCLDNDIYNLSEDNWVCLCGSHKILRRTRNKSIQELKDMAKEFFLDRKGIKRIYIHHSSSSSSLHNKTFDNIQMQKILSHESGDFRRA